ncbi:MAG: dTDP-4-dehydrorhamnose reductase [bacterium]|nr:dTDP-4-dehydrorhamnose reductase [bacterium]MDZ4286110.1 dTDP-4-dehydrorhamnose reductase [Candidatus Sungbacteria bacterium]
MMENKTIVVIGKTGQLGASLMVQASYFGFQAIGYGKEELDIQNTADVRAEIERIRPMAVVNASAYLVLRDCEEHPDIAAEINTHAVERLACLCRDLGVLFVHYSTDYVFDGEKGAPYGEDDESRPLQVYGISKREGEKKAVDAYPAGTLIIRTAGLYGGLTGSKAKGGNFVLNMLRDAKLRDKIDVGSDQTTSTSFSDDVAGGTFKLLIASAPGGIYHLVNESVCGWHTFGAEVLRMAGANASVVPVVRAEIAGAMRRPRYSALLNIKAASLGIVLPTWQDALARYTDYLKLHS